MIQKDILSQVRLDQTKVIPLKKHFVLKVVIKCDTQIIFSVISGTFLV